MGTLPGQTGGVYHFWGITHSTCPTSIAQCPMLGSDRYPPPDMQIAWVEPRCALQPSHIQDGKLAAAKDDESLVAQQLKGPIDMETS